MSQVKGIMENRLKSQTESCFKLFLLAVILVLVITLEVNVVQRKINLRLDR